QLLRPMVLLLGVTLAGGALITFMAPMSDSAGLRTLALLCMPVFAAFGRWRAGTLSGRFRAHVFIWPLVRVTAGGVVAVAWAGPLSYRFGAQLCPWPLGLVPAAGAAVMAWAVRDPPATVAPALLLGATLVGLSYGALQNLCLVVAFRAVSRPHYGSASAVWNIGFDTGTGLGSVMIGMIAGGSSFPIALLVGGAFSLLTLPLALRRPQPAREA